QEEEEPLPAPVPVADTPAEPIQEPQPEAVAETQPEPIAPAPQPVAQTPAPEQQPTPPAAGTGNSPNNGMAGSQQTIQVSQSYLGLRQMPGNKPPVYSRDMRRQGVQGRGQLVYFVTRDGRVTDLRLTRSTGSPALDQAAIDAFS